MKVVFFGTPDVAASHLESLAKENKHQILAVITRADKPRGRGQELLPSDVKQSALKLGISQILTPENIKTPEFLQTLQSFNADLGVVVAYGKLLPDTVINAPKLGCINVHFSLLPKLRGASPVEFAVWEGHKETGCTTFWIEKEMDAGDMIVQKSTAIDPAESAPELRKRLTTLGCETLSESLALIEKNQAPRIKQDHGKATFTRLIKKEDGAVNFKTQDAAAIDRTVRALREWPRVSFKFFGKNIQILKARALENVSGSWQESPDSPTPFYVEKGKGFVLKCAQGGLLVEEIQAEGKPPAAAWSYVQGLRLKI